MSPAYSHNFLRVHDAAGKNNIFNKINELGRIQDKRALGPIVLERKESFAAKMYRKIDSRRLRPGHQNQGEYLAEAVLYPLQPKKAGKIRSGLPAHLEKGKID